MIMISGFTIAYHKSKDKTFKHLGKYIDGLFSDRNKAYSPDSKIGWGFKVDLFLGRIIRPMYNMLKLANKKELEKPIHTVPENEWGSVFGVTLADRLIKKKRGVTIDNEKVHDYKFGIWNPWKAKYWFILDSYIRVPCLFISVSTPWRSFYVGVKTYNVTADLPPIPEGFTAEKMVEFADQGDFTWANGRIKDGEYGCLSGSIRRSR